MESRAPRVPAVWDSPRKARVSVVRCPGYNGSDLALALRQSFDWLGGLGTYLRRGTRVFIKVNHLSSAAPPERAVITHPSFVREVLRFFLDCGVRLTVGDDIASGQGDGFRKTGYRQMCDELGIRLVSLRETGFAEVALHGALSEKIYLAREVLDTDFILNLPKLKTHSFTVFTGAIKNMFGAMPHGLRLDFHRRFVRNDIFSRALVDVFSVARPQLTIMDAVLGMEGEGPSAGRPYKIGLLLAGEDAVAVDAVAARIIGLSPSEVMTTSSAHRRGLGVGDPRLIEVVGEEIEAVAARNFRLSAAATGLFRKWLPSRVYADVSGQLTLTPAVIPEKCQACRECLEVCPAKAVRLVGEAAWVDESSCIHCLCCHEVCPHQALRLKQRPVGRVIRAAETLYKKIRALCSKPWRSLG
ncbi:MAG: DUF362 domain-containing protein [Acidobacteriota bacterium]